MKYPGTVLERRLMVNWIFVDLAPFVDKIAPVLERFSIRHLSLDRLKFAMRKQKGAPQVIFFNGDEGVAQMKAQMKYVRKQDLVYLIVGLSEVSKERELEINKFLFSSSRIKGIIDNRQGTGFIFSQLNGIKEVSDLLFEIDTDNEYFEDFEKRLEKATQQTSMQLEKVKELHRALIPRKEIHFGPLKTICKYGAGDSLHSEFWDVSKTSEHQATLLLSTESSKELTKVLSHTIAFLDRTEYSAKDLKDYYQLLRDSLLEPFSLFLMLTTVGDMNSILIAHGPRLAFVNGAEFGPLKEGELSKIQLRRRDKFFIISSGMIKNYQKDFKNDDLVRILQKEWQLPSHDLLQKVFLNSKINKKGRFHHNDCTAIILEVDS